MCACVWVAACACALGTDEPRTRRGLRRCGSEPMPGRTWVHTGGCGAAGGAGGCPGAGWDHTLGWGWGSSVPEGLAGAERLPAGRRPLSPALRRSPSLGEGVGVRQAQVTGSLVCVSAAVPHTPLSGSHTAASDAASSVAPAAGWRRPSRAGIWSPSAGRAQRCWKAGGLFPTTGWAAPRSPRSAGLSPQPQQGSGLQSAALHSSPRWCGRAGGKERRTGAFHRGRTPIYRPPSQSGFPPSPRL